MLRGEPAGPAALGSGKTPLSHQDGTLLIPASCVRRGSWALPTPSEAGGRRESLRAGLADN